MAYPKIPGVSPTPPAVNPAQPIPDYYNKTGFDAPQYAEDVVPVYNNKSIDDNGYGTPPAQKQYNPDKNLMNQAYESPYAAQFNKDVDLIRQSAAPLNVTDTIDYKRRLSQQRDNRPSEWEIDNFIGNTGRSLPEARSWSSATGYRPNPGMEQQNALFMAGLEKDLRFGNEAARNAAEEAMYGSTAGHYGNRARSTQAALMNLAAKRQEGDSYARQNDLMFKTNQETNRLAQQRFNLDVQEKVTALAKEMLDSAPPGSTLEDMLPKAAAQYGYSGWPPPGGLGVSTTILDPSVTAPLRSAAGAPSGLGGTPPVSGGLGSGAPAPVLGGAAPAVGGEAGVPAGWRPKTEAELAMLSPRALRREQEIMVAARNIKEMQGMNIETAAKGLSASLGIKPEGDEFNAVQSAIADIAHESGGMVPVQGSREWNAMRLRVALKLKADSDGKMAVFGGADRYVPTLDQIRGVRTLDTPTARAGSWLASKLPFVDASKSGRYIELQDGSMLPADGIPQDILDAYLGKNNATKPGFSWSY